MKKRYLQVVENVDLLLCFSATSMTLSKGFARFPKFEFAPKHRLRCDSEILGDYAVAWRTN